MIEEYDFKTSQVIKEESFDWRCTESSVVKSLQTRDLSARILPCRLNPSEPFDTYSQSPLKAGRARTPARDEQL